MAEADWSLVSGSLAAGTIARGTTSAFARPNGGSNFVFGFNALAATTGVAGFFLDLANFNPLRDAGALATGGSIRFAVQRVAAGTNLGMNPFAFLCLRSGAGAAPDPSNNDVGYLLGLENSAPYRIVLVKGAPANGIPASGSSVLRTSTATFTAGQWHHLRLDAIVNPNGDVVLRVFSSDLVANPVTAPVWAAIAGMTDFTDDALGFLSGSSPLSGGFAGFCVQATTSGRLCLFDHVECLRQV